MQECKDYSGMFFILPFTKGFLVNWDIQRQIWDYVFRNVLKLNNDGKNRFSNIGLLITEPVFNFPQIRQLMIKILFEDYGFGKILITTSAQLAAFKYLFHVNQSSVKNDSDDFKEIKVNEKVSIGDSVHNNLSEMACIVLESGYSFTHVIPIVDGYKILDHTKRIDLGGKALTNYLKEIISYRQINVLDETYVVNQMKEDCCFVSVDFWKDLDSARRSKENSIMCDYILPDYLAHKRGFIFDRDKHKDLNMADFQTIRMNNERFQVPELLFHPSDVNIDQLGISETLVYSISEFNPNFEMLSSTNSLTESTGLSFCRERPENLKEDDEDEEEEEEDENDYDEEEADDEEMNEVTEDEEVTETSNADDEETDESSKTNRKRALNESSSSNTRTNRPRMNGNLKQSSANQQQSINSDSNVNQQNGASSRNDHKEIIENNLSIYNDENIQSHLYHNILLIGGNCKFANFKDRIYNDLRSNVPELIDIKITLPDDPIIYAWQGGHLLCSIDDQGQKSTNHARSLFHKYAVTKKEYHRKGLDHCYTKLSNYKLSIF
ncbi:DNA repair and recombination protein RadA [Sarcoptes scabiei]|nr:DNA repair and recombination protein RadA [Sarcoptes scabiei]